jgi:peptidoglycan/LPS O-acetylase OafA/YrhL
MTTRKDIAALTSLRGIAALAVLIYHSTFSFRGYLGVDLFFLLSGFVLAHVYGRMELSRQTYCGILKARFAWISGALPDAGTNVAVVEQY